MEPYGTTRNTYFGKQDKRTDGWTNRQTDSLLELARFYPAAKKLTDWQTDWQTKYIKHEMATIMIKIQDLEMIDSSYAIVHLKITLSSSWN